MLEQHVFRLVWLSGGVVAANPPGPEVELSAGPRGPFIAKVQVDPPSLLPALRREGFVVIGVTFVTSPEEQQGLQSPEFRAAAPSGGWRIFEVHQQWRRIAFAAGKLDKMPLMDLASRIASNLTYSQIRLGDLAREYSRELRGHLTGQEAKEYVAFRDVNSYHVYKAIHGLFWEMAVLRDRLAEFVASFCLERPKITTLTGLRRSLKKQPSNDSIAAELLSMSEPPTGWLARFGSYRDCFTHRASMEHAANIASVVQELRVISPRLTVPQVYFPLPADIEDLMKKRSEGVLFNSTKELAEASSRRHNRASEPDALEYLYDCLDRLATLAAELVKRSPIPPRPIEIRREDIVGEVRVSRG